MSHATTISTHCLRSMSRRVETARDPYQKSLPPYLRSPESGVPVDLGPAPFTGILSLTYQKSHLTQFHGSRNSTNSIRPGLMTLEAASMSGDVVVDNAWRGAEAYHFWLLAHRQLYAGNVDLAMRTALHLRAYEDLLDPLEVYAFLALACFYNKFYGQCSKVGVRVCFIQKRSSLGGLVARWCSAVVVKGLHVSQAV